MNTHADKAQEANSRAVANEDSHRQSGGESTYQIVDNRPEAIVQRRLQEMANNHMSAKGNEVVQFGAYNVGGGYTFTSTSGKIDDSLSYSRNSRKDMAVIYGRVTGPGNYNKTGEVHVHLSRPRGKIRPGMKITHTSGAHYDTGGIRYYPFTVGTGTGLIAGILAQMLNEHIKGWDDYPK